MMPRRAFPWRSLIPEVFACAGLLFLKHLLVRDQLVSAFVGPHDDYLFARLSDYLFHGQWLGPYDNRTLAKGMVYPLFLAAIRAVHLPLLAAHHGLYAVACIGAVEALRPILPSRSLRVAAFAALLFFPGNFVMTRTVRDGIYSSLTLITLSAGLGLAFRPHARAAQGMGWSALLGLSAAATWFTREESLWLAPSLAVFSTIFALQARPRAALAPWVAIGIAWLLLAGTNYTYYGLFAPRDMLTRGINDAYGALLRLHTADFAIEVPVPVAVRAKLYPVSPAFRELQPFLEGKLGADWASVQQAAPKTVPANEIDGGHFIWALRDAVQFAGYYKSGATAEAYYRRLAAEVNDACDRGLVKAGPPHSGLAMPWRSYYLRPFLGTASRGAETFLALPPYPGPQPSRGPEDGQRFLHQAVLGKSAPLDTPTPAPWVNPVAEEARRTVSRFYSATFRWLLAASVVAAGIAFLRDKQRLIPGLAALALLLAVGVRMALLVYISTTSFEALKYSYISATYIPALLFCVVAWGWYGVDRARPPA